MATDAEVEEAPCCAAKQNLRLCASFSIVNCPPPRSYNSYRSGRFECLAHPRSQR